MFKKIYIALFLLAFIPHTALAFCFEEAGATYGISPLLLWSIAKHESNFNPYAVGHNSNGTYDYGLMQINSSWAKRLGREHWKKLGDPCTNVKTGAWILSQCVKRHGYGWKAVGCYNSSTPGKRDRYAGRIARTMAKAARPYPSPSDINYTATKQTQIPAAPMDPWADVFGTAL